MLDLVIPDSGPLITLGSIDRLDLIDRFRCGILIADMVGYEIECGPDTAPDKAAFSKWFKGRGNRVQTVDTIYGSMWSKLSEEDRKIVKRQNPHAGELAIREDRIIARQACFRPLTQDGLPLIGKVPSVEGAYVATGHNVWGILNAPATGEVLAELIADGVARSTDLTPFDPMRLRPLDTSRLRSS